MSTFTSVVFLHLGKRIQGGKAVIASQIPVTIGYFCALGLRHLTNYDRGGKGHRAEQEFSIKLNPPIARSQQAEFHAGMSMGFIEVIINEPPQRLAGLSGYLQAAAIQAVKNQNYLIAAYTNTIPLGDQTLQIQQMKDQYAKVYAALSSMKVTLTEQGNMVQNKEQAQNEAAIQQKIQVDIGRQAALASAKAKLQRVSLQLESDLLQAVGRSEVVLTSRYFPLLKDAVQRTMEELDKQADQASWLSSWTQSDQTKQLSAEIKVALGNIQDMMEYIGADLGGAEEIVQRAAEITSSAQQKIDNLQYRLETEPLSLDQAQKLAAQIHKWQNTQTVMAQRGKEKLITPIETRVKNLAGIWYATMDLASKIGDAGELVTTPVEQISQFETMLASIDDAVEGDREELKRLLKQEAVLKAIFGKASKRAQVWHEEGMDMSDEIDKTFYKAVREEEKDFSKVYWHVSRLHQQIHGTPLPYAQQHIYDFKMTPALAAIVGAAVLTPQEKYEAIDRITRGSESAHAVITNLILAKARQGASSWAEILGKTPGAAFEVGEELQFNSLLQALPNSLAVGITNDPSQTMLQKLGHLLANYDMMISETTRTGDMRKIEDLYAYLGLTSDYIQLHQESPATITPTNNSTSESRRGFNWKVVLAPLTRGLLAGDPRRALIDGAAAVAGELVNSGSLNQATEGLFPTEGETRQPAHDQEAVNRGLLEASPRHIGGADDVPTPLNPPVPPNPSGTLTDPSAFYTRLQSILSGNTRPTVGKLPERIIPAFTISTDDGTVLNVTRGNYDFPFLKPIFPAPHVGILTYQDLKPATQAEANEFTASNTRFKDLADSLRAANKMAKEKAASRAHGAQRPVYNPEARAAMEGRELAPGQADLERIQQRFNT